MWSNVWQNLLPLLSLATKTSSSAGVCTGSQPKSSKLTTLKNTNIYPHQAPSALPLPREVWRLLPREAWQPWLAQVSGNGDNLPIHWCTAFSLLDKIMWCSLFEDQSVLQQPLCARKNALYCMEQLGWAEGILRLYNRCPGRPPSWRGQCHHSQLEDEGSEVGQNLVIKKTQFLYFSLQVQL